MIFSSINFQKKLLNHFRVFCREIDIQKWKKLRLNFSKYVWSGMEGARSYVKGLVVLKIAQSEKLKHVKPSRPIPSRILIALTNYSIHRQYLQK